MDIILAHRRSMKLGELAGLSLAAQTTFATAVSEISRYAIDFMQQPLLRLGINLADKLVLAVVENDQPVIDKHHPNLHYARKLADRFIVHEQSIETGFRTPSNNRLTEQSIKFWESSFSQEYPLSPYDEIKRKNIQLQQLSERLAASELKYKQLSESVPLMIFTLDEAGRLLHANHWLQDFTGASVEELQAQHWQQVMHPEDWQLLRITWENEAGLRQPMHFEYRLRNKDTDEYVWHMASSIPFKDNNGSSGWIGYAVNIHHQKLIEQTLKDNKELHDVQAKLKANQVELESKIHELNRSNLELAQFAYVASHDLQEPLRKIMVYSDFLQRKYSQIDQSGVAILKNMISATTRMKQLIEDLLLFSRISSGRQAFTHASLQSMFDEVLQDFDMKIQEQQVIIHAEQLPEVYCIPQHLKQVFANLLSNSIKYARTGIAPEVNVKADRNDEGVTIYFSDNGIGFDNKYADKIFGMFQRLHTREEFEGTGIGLSLAKKIVDMHRGNISANSQPGQGTTFIISLPNGVEES